jgi:hypothetical protein
MTRMHGKNEIQGLQKRTTKIREQNDETNHTNKKECFNIALILFV